MPSIPHPFQDFSRISPSPAPQGLRQKYMTQASSLRAGSRRDIGIRTRPPRKCRQHWWPDLRHSPRFRPWCSAWPEKLSSALRADPRRRTFRRFPESLRACGPVSRAGCASRPDTLPAARQCRVFHGRRRGESRAWRYPSEQDSRTSDTILPENKIVPPQECFSVHASPPDCAAPTRARPRRARIRSSVEACLRPESPSDAPG